MTSEQIWPVLPVKEECAGVLTSADSESARELVRSPHTFASEPQFQEVPISLRSGVRRSRDDLHGDSLAQREGKERVAMALGTNEQQQQQQQLEIDRVRSLELRSSVCLRLRAPIVSMHSARRKSQMQVCVRTVQ